VEIAHIVNSRFGIPFIFVTAFVDPATIERVKHTYPFGYIVKPYSDIDIRIAIDIALSRAANLSAGKAINAGVKKENTVFIKSDKGLKKFEINDILWMEAYDYYSFIHTRNEKILATITLKEVEQKLNNDIFVRIHRKYTININHIERIVGNQVEIGGNLIPIGRANREEFLMKIKRL
jgi:DNA-binding LytR/AlgR family response regulator